MLDYLIKNATVFDGIQVEPQKLTVGIQGDRIVFAGHGAGQPEAREVIDAKNLYLCPGFIDTHASTGLGYTFPNAGDNKLLQGVTTEVIGNCGTSAAPVGELLVPTMNELAEQIGFDFNWRSLADWFNLIEDYGLPFNIGTYVGHSTLRAGICSDSQQVTHNEIEEMCQMLDAAMRHGVLGLSTGLVYAPGSFAATAEIVELAKIAAKHDGIYVSHIRNERESLEDSVEEAIDIGKYAKLPVLVSHLKAAEKPNWGKIPRIIERLEQARAKGIKVNIEVYPYTAVSTKLRTFIPKETLKDGVGALGQRLQKAEWRQRCVGWLEFRKTDYEAMHLITESLPGVRGKSIAQIAREKQQTPPAIVVDILLRDPDAWIVYHCISEDDMDAAILWPHSIVCSDSWSYPINAPNQIGDPHPRTFGAFTRFLEKYALQQERVKFGHAVQKISSFPADWVRLPDRGRIAEGCFADLTLLNPDEVKEKATFENPRQFSSGTEYVWVNGVMMLERGQLRKELPGQVLRRTD